MNKTKQRILEAALNLFNDIGYQQVTIRMIALELKMSSGNLNYHFKKREDLLEALYFQMVTDFDQRVEDLAETDISFYQIKTDIRSSMERMVQYKFIWTDLYNLLKLSDKIFDHFSTVNKKRVEGNLYLFDRLNKMGLMRKAKIPGEYEMLAQRMVNFGDTWIYSSEIYRLKNTKEYIDSQSNTMITMLYPYLTPEGEKAYLETI